MDRSIPKSRLRPGGSICVGQMKSTPQISSPRSARAARRSAGSSGAGRENRRSGRAAGQGARGRHPAAHHRGQLRRPGPQPGGDRAEAFRPARRNSRSSTSIPELAKAESRHAAEIESLKADNASVAAPSSFKREQCAELQDYIDTMRKAGRDHLGIGAHGHALRERINDVASEVVRVAVALEGSTRRSISWSPARPRAPRRRARRPPWPAKTARVRCPPPRRREWTEAAAHSPHPRASPAHRALGCHALTGNGVCDDSSRAPSSQVALSRVASSQVGVCSE